MSASVTPLPAAREAFERLIDYAGLFPPARLEMTPALTEYADAKGGPFAWMLGRFIVPASRIGQLRESRRGARDSTMPLSVIVDAGGDVRTWLDDATNVIASLPAPAHAQLAIEALEVPLPPLQTARDTYDAPVGQFAMLARNSGFANVPVYVELPRGPRWRDALPGAMFALARHRLGAKVRCGGVTADAFPPPEDVAAFLRAAADERVPFKATAGLHHPIRRLDATTGFHMHGFLNFLVASLLASHGAGVDDLTRILSDEDAHAFAFDSTGLRWREHHVPTEEIAAARTHGFVAYGSCSFDEPTADLQAMGIL